MGGDSEKREVQGSNDESAVAEKDSKEDIVDITKNIQSAKKEEDADDGEKEIKRDKEDKEDEGNDVKEDETNDNKDDDKEQEKENDKEDQVKKTDKAEHQEGKESLASGDCEKRMILYSGKQLVKAPKNEQKSALACQKSCKKKPDCSHWTYNRQNKWCFEFSGEVKEVDDKNYFLSGPVACVPKDSKANQCLEP